MANNPSYGARIDELLKSYLHSAGMRNKVADAAHAADAAVKAELAPHVKTGDLFRGSDAEVHEFDAGYGMEITSFYVGFFNWNKHGIRRLREPGYRRGQGMRRKRGYKAHAPVMKVHSPSVFGTAIETFGKSISVWEG